MARPSRNQREEFCPPVDSNLGMLFLLFMLIMLLERATPHGHSCEAANRVKCSNHLRQIGMGIAVYANNSGFR